MEEMTFVTGVELLGQAPTLNTVSADTKPKEEKQLPPALRVATNKSTRPIQGGNKSPQPNKVESFPPISQSRDTTAKPALRNSMTEASFKKPLFQKLALVKEYFEKTKDFQENKNRQTTSAASHKPLTHWKNKSENVKKEDGKNYTHADAFNTQIVKKFDDIYSKKESTQKPEEQNRYEKKDKTAQFDHLQKRKHFFDEIEKQEGKVQTEQKRFNQMTYEIARKQALLENLEFQMKELDKKVDNTTTLEELGKQKEEDKQEWTLKIEALELHNECLGRMKQTKKEDLLTDRKNYLKLKQLWDAKVEESQKTQKGHNQLQQEICALEFEGKNLLSKRGTREDNMIDPEFEEILNNEISEFEERRNLQEIFKHEKVLDDEKRLKNEQEHLRKMEERENQLKQEREGQIQREAEDQKKLDRIKQIFHAFQKVTHVSRKEQLIEYYDGLEDRSSALSQEITSVDENIKARKEELVQLRQQLKYKKFEEEKKPKDKFPEETRIDDLEKMLREKTTEVVERDAHNKRLEKLSYEVCTVVSRILKQVQKNKAPITVDKNNVIDMISYCGLQLERMLTVVIKKKKVMFLESINTNADLKEGPPSYMNIISDDVYTKSRKRAEKDKLPTEIIEDSEERYLEAQRQDVITRAGHEIEK